MLMHGPLRQALKGSAVQKASQMTDLLHDIRSIITNAPDGKATPSYRLEEFRMSRME